MKLMKLWMLAAILTLCGATTALAQTCYDYIERAWDSDNKVVTETTKTLNESDYTAINGSDTSDSGLANDADNSEKLYKYNDITAHSVTLSGRTLYKDGKWNTLCLPFNLTAAQIAAHEDFVGAEIRELSNASFDGGTLTLNFTPATGEGAVTSITAGTPCIVKWESGSDFTPTFSGVTIDATARNKACDLGDGKSITFRGTYAPVIYDGENKSVLFLSGSNTLYYPDGTGTTTIGTCRAYFELDGLTAGDKASEARAFVLNFGDNETAIVSVSKESGSEGVADDWYTLDGRRLSATPTKSGIYVNNGRKIVIK